MSVNLRYPQITGNTPAEQMVQTKRYLRQLVDQLNFALQEVGDRYATTANASSVSASSQADKEKQALLAFNDIKALIIKSADIVNAYYDEINTRLEGVYVAESDFGSFAEHTTQEIQENSTNIEQMFTNIQTIVTDLEGLESRLIEANAYINSGLLDYDKNTGVPVYGLEIGQRNTIDGVEVFNKYAQFTADRLAFFDSNGFEVAYVSDRKLYITTVEVTGELIRGALVDIVQPDKTIVTKWIQ